MLKEIFINNHRLAFSVERGFFVAHWSQRSFYSQTLDRTFSVNSFFVFQIYWVKEAFFNQPCRDSSLKEVFISCRIHLTCWVKGPRLYQPRQTFLVKKLFHVSSTSSLLILFSINEDFKDNDQDPDVDLYQKQISALDTSYYIPNEVKEKQENVQQKSFSILRFWAKTSYHFETF